MKDNQPRSEMTLQTMADYSAFLADMEATPENVVYLNRVYKVLNDLKPGASIEIDKLTILANLRKFIGCVCLYIWDTNKAEFDSEYKNIKKL